jgi:hypothetical protein
MRGHATLGDERQRATGPTATTTTRRAAEPAAHGDGRISPDEIPGHLAQFEDLVGAERIEHLADSRIVESLQQIDFDPDSPEWQEVSGALIEYGHAVLVAWAITGSLYRHAAKHGVLGLGRLPQDLSLPQDEAEALALDVVIVAVEAFRTKSLPIWRSTGGASLKTYFIGRCLMELPDVHRQWKNRERPVEPLWTVDDGRLGAFPADEAEARVLLDKLFQDHPILRQAFELQQYGYNLKEIADLLSSPEAPLTVPGLRTSMHRFRVRAIERGVSR